MIRVGCFLLFFTFGCSNNVILNDSDFDVVNSENVSHEEWWKSFKDPKLNALVEELSNNNLQLQSLNKKIRISELGILSNQYENGASINAGVTSSHNRRLDVSENTTNAYSSSIGIGYTFEPYGKKMKGEQLTILDMKSSYQEFKKLRLSLIKDLVNAYIKLGTLSEKIDFYKSLQKIHYDLLVIENARYQQGMTLVTSLNEVKLTIKSTQSQIDNIYNSQQEIINTIRNLINDYSFNLTPLSTYVTNKSLWPIIDLSKPSNLIQFHPDVIQAKINIQRSILDLDIKKLNIYPEISLSANLSGGGEKILELLNNPLGSIASSIVFPFFELHKKNLDIEISSLELKNSYVELEGILSSSLNDLNNIVLEIQTSHVNQELAKQSFSTLTKNLDVMEMKWRYGSASTEEVLKLKEDVIRSQISLLEHDENVLLSLVSFCHVTAFEGCK
jgi:outer membrane protein TolC